MEYIIQLQSESRSNHISETVEVWDQPNSAVVHLSFGRVSLLRSVQRGSLQSWATRFGSGSVVIRLGASILEAYNLGAYNFKLPDLELDVQLHAHGDTHTHSYIYTASLRQVAPKGASVTGGPKRVTYPE